MPSGQDVALLRECAVAILRDAAFVFSEEAEQPTPLPGEVLEVSMACRFPEPVRLVLRCTLPFASLVATNLLGKEPDEPVPLEDAHGAVAELVNMIGGSLMERRCADRSQGHLGLPEVRLLGGEAELAPLAGALRVTLLTDEGERIDVLLADEPRP
jgi:hypothetical protein